MTNESTELHYAILIFALFILPRVLMRFRLPGAITALALGTACGITTDLFEFDLSIKLLSTFGIVSLFLFAGLDVDFEELRSNAKVISVHVVLGIVLLTILAILAQRLFIMESRAAWLFAMALLTPSCGFILDSLDSSSLPQQNKFWIKSKAIATELVALAVMFFLLQTPTFTGLGMSTLSLALMIALVPVAFKVFARRIAPLAPNSEFAFMIIIALICAMITRKLGAYYLVGAFIVGMTAHRFEKLLPELKSGKMLHAIQLFASFFTPFYFFGAGLGITSEDLSFKSIFLGLALVVVVAPLRIGVTALQRRVALKEPFEQSFPVAVSLLPTLVFGLVLAGILKTQFNIDRQLFGALMIYTVVITIIPGIVLKAVPKSAKSIEYGAGPELPLM